MRMRRKIMRRRKRRRRTRPTLFEVESVW